ncbi:MAG: 50S ribosomal protein L32 [bacterium]|nr:50S ribosomal protein L32 [bacterium]
MGVPRHRRTKSKQGHRRSHLALKKRVLTVCSKCGAKVLSHVICVNCGSYKGKQIIDMVAKAAKKKAKKKSGK